MRVLFLNPPAPERVMRRWTASYYAPNFLMPPMELMGLAALARDWKGCDVLLLDAVARDLGVDRVRREAASFGPDVIVLAAGFSTLPGDLATAAALVSDHPRATVCITGFLASEFPADVLQHCPVHVILLDEPELAFADLLDCLAARSSLAGVPGLAFRDGQQPIVNARRPRIDDLDRLPLPDHSLVDLSLYSEPLRPGPIGVTLSARGCSHACVFCTRTYGRQMRYRSPTHILDEARLLAGRHGVRNLRFMDDTLPLDRPRLLELCRLLSRERLDLEWTALSRLDNLDPPLLAAMRRAGCRRLYIGLESASQHVLDSLHKGYRADQMPRLVRQVRDAGIEFSAFFIVGTPWETPSDVEASIQAAIDWELDFVIVTRLQYWPGTPLGLDTRPPSLFPFRPVTAPDSTLATEQNFYRRFYLRPGYALRHLGRALLRPSDAWLGLKRLAGYVRQSPNHDLI